jgi:hypothetical protein
MPKRTVAVAGSGGVGGGAHGVLELVGARAIPISSARDAAGCTFESGVMANGSFAAFGAVGNQRPLIARTACGGPCDLDVPPGTTKPCKQFGRKPNRLG